MPIDYNSFIHPRDKAAMASLKAIPGFDSLMRMYMKFFDEKFLHCINMASKIRINSNQLPQIYAMLQDVCEKLGLNEPELYVESGPINAYTFGETKPFIVLQSGAINALTEREIKSVLAHECGHILCHHTLYSSLAYYMMKFGIEVFGLTASAIMPIYWALMYWKRCSELSADRVDAYVMDDPKIVAEKLMKLSGGFLFIHDIEFNFDEYMNQASDYLDMLDKSKVNKIMQAWLIKDREHPFPAIRAVEVYKWFESEHNNLPHFSNAAETLAW